MQPRTHLHAFSFVLAVAVVFSDIQPGYLDFDNLPETNFSCEGKVIGGYYADVETGCQMFHVCTIGQKGEISDIKFLCLNGTVFDQETRVCERIDEVDCDKSEDFFNLNLELYGNTANFGAQECGDDECQQEDDDEEVEDAEYDDDTETTTIVTTTTTTRATTTTTRPTTVRTTVPPTAHRTRYTTQSSDSLSALLALHNAFNQGLNRRPILHSVPTTRVPSVPTTTRRPTLPLTLRTRFGSNSDTRQDHGYILRPTLRPTFQPLFTSSLQPTLKSNYHTFESGDAHFEHSFDPDKPYHFQYFSQKSSPSPFSVRIEPQISIVTSTSTSTSVKIANTTIDDFPYDEYDDIDPFFHDVPKLNRPKRSTTRRTTSKNIKISSDKVSTPSGFVKKIENSTSNVKDVKTDLILHGGQTPSGFVKQQNEETDQQFSSSDKNEQSTADHVIKIDPDDVISSKNNTEDASQPKTEYLTNLLDSIALEDGEKKQVFDLFQKSEPEMEQLLGSKGADMMLEKLENKLLEMDLEGRASGVPFEYEGESFEIREKRGSDDKIYKNEHKEEEIEQEYKCNNPNFCIDVKDEDVIQLEIQDNRKKRSTIRRVSRIRVDHQSNVRRNDDEDKYSTQSSVETTKKSRRKNQSNRNQQNHNYDGSKTNWDSRRQTTRRNDDRTTRRTDIKPVTEEIEGDITTAEYRRPAVPFVNKLKYNRNDESTTPYSIYSSTRLQTRYEYNNQNLTTRKSQSTLKPTNLKHAPVYEEDAANIEITKQKPQRKRIRKRSPIIVKDDATDSQRSSDNESAKIPRDLHQTRRRTTQDRRTLHHQPLIDTSTDPDSIEHIRNNRRDNDTKSRNHSSRKSISIDTYEANKNPSDLKDTQTHLIDNRSRRNRVKADRFHSDRPSIHNDNSNTQTGFESNVMMSDDVQLFNPKKVEIETGSLMNPIDRTSVHYLNSNVDNNSYRRIKINDNNNYRRSDNDRTVQSDMTDRRTQQTNRRRKVVRNRYETDGSSLRENSQSERQNIGHSEQNNGRNRQNMNNNEHFRQIDHNTRHNEQNIGHNEQNIRGNEQNTGRHRQNIKNNEHFRQIEQNIRHNEQNIGHNRQSITRNEQNTRLSTQNIRQNGQNFGSDVQNIGLNRQSIKNNRPFSREEQNTGHNTQNIGHNEQNIGRNQQNLGRHELKSNNSEGSIENQQDTTTTRTIPPTPYTPRPGIEPDPNFSCRGKVKGGLYADVHADCFGFFICSQARRGISPTHFWCGVGTKFNQKSRTCQTESLVDCSVAQRYYHLNDNQYNPSIDLEEQLRGSFEPMRTITRK